MRKHIRFWIYSLLAIGAFLMFTNSCKKDDGNNNPNSSGTVTDIDGNVYKTVTIGTQVWMAENLKTTRYRDGTSIPTATNDPSFSSINSPAYCWYNNNISNKNVYGALYNSFVVNTGKLAPIGWHVPSDYEWEILIAFLGGETVAGGKLKETGTKHWSAPNVGATDDIGFKALPGGLYLTKGEFNFICDFGEWWSSTSDLDHSGTGWSYHLSSTYILIGKSGSNDHLGFSIRCIKD